MTDTVTISVRIGEHEIYRNYGIEDGQVPEDMQEIIQDMANTLLDKSEL